jgi:Transposase DDE domain
MSRKHRYGNPDFRRRVNVPAPPIEAVETRLRDLLTVGTFANLKQRGVDGQALRDRKLTLPVLCVIVLSLVYRQINGLSEVVRVLAQTGLFWLKPLSVSKQALSKRLQVVPVQRFAQLWEQVLLRMPAGCDARIVPTAWRSLQAKFSVVAMADGSALEALVKKVERLRSVQFPLGGKMMVMVDAWSLRPLGLWHKDNAKANDRSWGEQLLERLPVNGLLIFDLGFFSFPWFDAFTDAHKWFVTRLQAKTAYQVRCTLSEGRFYRDQLIQVGLHHTHPCNHPLRLVSVLWGKTWYTYLTNVLDPNLLSAQQVCDLYRRRWRIEDAFLLTKRLLGLSYLWVGNSNGVQIQLYCTWIFYAVLMDLCAEVAIALHQPLEKISVEMVFRSLYHFSRARELGRETDLIPFLVDNAKGLGLIKAPRKRQRRVKAQSLDIWADALS